MKHLVFFKRGLLLFLLFAFFDFLISVVLLNGYDRYFGFRQNPEVLINGSSMSMSGFDREEIGYMINKQVAAYSLEGVSVYARYEMINHYFQMYPEGLQTLIYEVNPLILTATKSAENVYTHFYPYMDDKNINKYIYAQTTKKEYYTHKLIRTLRFDPRLIRLIMMGYLGKYNNMKTNTLDSIDIGNLTHQKGKVAIVLDESSIETFENTMDLVRSGRNTNVILVMMPMYQSKLETFKKEDFSNLCTYFIDFCSREEDVQFLNLNQDSLTNNPKYFSDPLHFNIYGQRQITNIVSAYMNAN